MGGLVGLSENVAMDVDAITISIPGLLIYNWGLPDYHPEKAAFMSPIII